MGKRIKEIRERRGLTQDELGRILGVKKAAVQKIESGKTGIDTGKLALICETLGVLPASLLYGSFPSLWERVYGIKAIGETPPLEDLRLISRLESLIEARFGSMGIALLRNMDSLNDQGIERAVAYVGDLVKIEEYTVSGSEPSRKTNLDLRGEEAWLKKG